MRVECSRYKYEGSNIGFKVKVPCNMVKDGHCGIDAKPCSIVIIVGENRVKNK